MGCMDGEPGEYRERVVEVWPPEVAYHMRRYGKQDNRSPHNPACQSAALPGRLEIASPKAGGFYAVNPRLPLAQQRIALQVKSVTQNEQVFWFLDDLLVHQGSTDEVFFITPEAGRHVLRVVDTRGGSDRVSFTVHDDTRKSLQLSRASWREEDI